MGAPTDAVVLVGGLGTRLNALTHNCPKPLLPVGGKPFLEVLLWQLERFGFERVLLSAGHLAHQVEAYAAQARTRFAMDLVVVSEPEPLGTAGAIRHLLPHTSGCFLLMNGDSLFDFNLLDLVPLLDAHPEAIVAMSLRRLDDASRFGVVALEGEAVAGFHERGDANGGLVNAGVYLIDGGRLTDLPERGSLEREVLPGLAQAGAVCGRVYDGFFLDIGVPEAYAAANTSVTANARRPAVFFDRDGVINVDHGYVGTVDRFEWVEGAVAAVKHVNDRGYFAFLITNQAGVARGFYGEDDVARLHEYLQRELRAAGAHFDSIRYCPHHPDGTVPGYGHACGWRKPEPGMILDLLARWPVDPLHSLVVGDKASDIQAARRAGLVGAQFPGGDLHSFLERLSLTARRPRAGSRELSGASRDALGGRSD